MSLKSEWKKFETRVRTWWHGFVEKHIVAPDPYDTEDDDLPPPAAPQGLPTPSLASCWDGNNASRRLMNILSPKMSDATFDERVKWMEGRGCNTAHVFLVNKADGEAAGYDCATDAKAREVAKARIGTLRRRGFCVVPWLLADDSKAWAQDFFGHAEERCRTLADAGLFDGAGAVVLGLEMDEPKSFPDGDSGWPKVRAALRKVWDGPIGVHHCSGNGFKYASLGDIVFGQLEPSAATEKAIKGQIAAIRAKGKRAFGFEYERKPNRTKSQQALAAGAEGVGNW